MFLKKVVLFINNVFLWSDFSKRFNVLRLFEKSKHKKDINRSAQDCNDEFKVLLSFIFCIIIVLYAYN